MSHPLPARPSLSLLKNQAKALRKSFSSNQPDARLRVQTYHPSFSNVVPDDLSLRDAQLVVAREYGFENWSDLKHKVEVESEKTHFQEHKSDRIKTCTSSEEEIAFVIQAACGSMPVRTERNTNDYSNEIHLVETQDGQRVVYRANWYCKDPHFENERWALEQCAAVGIPVPRMLYLNHEFEGHPKRSVCVLSFMEGMPLRARLNQRALSDADYHHVLQQVGEWYGRLHTLSTDGFGALSAQGQGAQKDWETAYANDLNHEQLFQAAHNAEIANVLIDDALSLLEDCASLGQSVSPVLLHGDFGLPHMMVEDERAVGLIDFEHCEGGDPAKEVAWGKASVSVWWDRFTGHESPKIPTKNLLEGYRRIQNVDEVFLRRAEWFSLWGCLQGVCYHGLHHVNMAGMLPFLKWRFQHDLERAQKMLK